MQRRFTTFRDMETGEYIIAISSVSKAVQTIPGYPSIRRLSTPFIGLLKADTVDKLANSWNIVVLM